MQICSSLENRFQIQSPEKTKQKFAELEILLKNYENQLFLNWLKNVDVNLNHSLLFKLKNEALLRGPKYRLNVFAHRLESAENNRKITTTLPISTLIDLSKVKTSPKLSLMNKSKVK